MTSVYHEPRTWDEARAALREHSDDATVLAGGTAYTLLLRQGLIRPGHVVALRRVADAERIDSDAHGGLSIGAMATHNAVARSQAVMRTWPELADAVSKVATVRVRNQATVGGSVAHADPASDAPVMLSALGAQAVVLGDGGRRRAPIDDLLVDTFTTSLAPDELIQSIEVPGRAPTAQVPPTSSAAKYTSAPRSHAVGVFGDVTDGVLRGLRIFLGGVGPRPMRARAVESALTGQRADRIADAAALVRDEVDPIDDVRGSAAYKREMSRVWTERALRRLLS